MLVDAAMADDAEEGEIVLEKGDPAQFGKSFLEDEEEEPIAVG